MVLPAPDFVSALCINMKNFFKNEQSQSTSAYICGLNRWHQVLYPQVYRAVVRQFDRKFSAI